VVCGERITISRDGRYFPSTLKWIGYASPEKGGDVETEEERRRIYFVIVSNYKEARRPILTPARS
jgi:hypothetical protein